ncbi:MAG: hypothetical protein WBF42_13945 [Terracidiphilus sp.]
MIDVKDAQAQMERMMQLDFGPRGREQRQEVLRVMCGARTVLIVQSAVTAWLDAANPKFPKPGELGQIITSLNVTHDQAMETERRRREWAAAKAAAPALSNPERDRKELRALFAQRLATVDERHPDADLRERGRIRKELARMLAHIDGGATLQQLAGVAAKPVSENDAYHGEF